MPKRYWVTGAQGFVGRYLVSHLLKSDPEAHVVGLGRSRELAASFTHSVHWGERALPAPLPPTLTLSATSSRYRYVACALGNRSELGRLLEADPPDVMFHLAAGLRDDPALALFETNVLGTFALVDAIARARVRRIVLASSGGVYGMPDALPLREDAVCQPADLYSASKLAAEHVARIVGAEHGVSLACARLFNIVGPGQDERHAGGRFAGCAAAIRDGVLPPRLETGQLSSTRDFVDVRDVASALELLAVETTLPGTYNVASGRECSIRELLDRILESAGLNHEVEVTQASGHRAGVPRHVASIEKLCAAGWAPRFTLQRSISELLDYYAAIVRPRAELG
jgi:GDP-4-dehydro-6-deoxy-D-mannose reductase